MQDNLTATTASRREHLLESTPDVLRVLERVQRVAVIGIKPAIVGGPAFYVPQRMQQAGYEIIPVPVYYAEIPEILGAPVHRSLESISPPVDMVQLFRRPNDIPRHLHEILAHKPRVVWMQLGIRHDEVAEQLARAGIDVVQDRCVKVELDRIRR
ncbi:CoA-binding protein [Gemmatimonas sp.]|uniref:CoA-binding protein n=1 Tax=Gemmatimonas sp. TaxID=1962908 RepID=UPI0037C0C352